MINTRASLEEQRDTEGYCLWAFVETIFDIERLEDVVKSVKWFDPIIQITSRVGPSLGPSSEKRRQICKANSRYFMDEI